MSRRLKILKIFLVWMPVAESGQARFPPTFSLGGRTRLVIDFVDIQSGDPSSGGRFPQNWR